MPNFAAAAAVCRAWFDWVAPCVMTMSAFFASASPIRNSSLRVLLPPDGQPGAVVALDPEVRAAEQAGEVAHRLEGRRRVRQPHAGKSGQLHLVLASGGVISNTWRR